MSMFDAQIALQNRYQVCLMPYKILISVSSTLAQLRLVHELFNLYLLTKMAKFDPPPPPYAHVILLRPPSLRTHSYRSDPPIF